MSRYFDRKGNPITMREWGVALETTDRHVGLTDLADGTRVSTVWLGLDHRFPRDTGLPPLIFETMVFPPGSLSELDMRRYATEEEALKGHAELVQEWAAKAGAQS